MHALAQQALDLCHAADGALVLDDAAVGAIADAWGALDDAFAGADAVLAAALVLLEKPAGKPAAKTLLSLVLAVQPALVAKDAARAAAVKARAEDAGAAFKVFAGDDVKKGVLDSGARPAGTTAAGPLARFTVAVPAKKTTT